MKYDAVLFDLDGTLLDTLEDLADAVNHTLDAMGYPARTIDEVREFVGNGAVNLIRRALPDGEHDSIERGVNLFRAHYGANLDVKTEPYPGVIALLEELRRRGVRIGVVSNKPDAAVAPLCRAYFPGLIDIAFGERAGVAKKPSPQALHEAMDTLRTSAECAIYCGDSDVDVETAHNADMKCIAVSWGFRSADSLRAAGADAVIDRAEEFLGAAESL